MALQNGSSVVMSARNGGDVASPKMGTLGSPGFYGDFLGVAEFDEGLCKSCVEQHHMSYSLNSRI